MFIETSTFVNAGSIARLFSPNYLGNSKTGGQCFQFWYHMYGSSIGKLTLSVDRAGTPAPTLLWTKQGNQGNQWFIGQATIQNQIGFKVIQSSYQRCLNSYVIVDIFLMNLNELFLSLYLKRQEEQASLEILQ